MRNNKTTIGPGSDDLHFAPLEVKISADDQSRDRFEMYIKRFRAKVTKDRIMSDWKEHQSYEKPSDKKRRKRREAVQRNKKLEMMDKLGLKEDRNGKRYKKSSKPRMDEDE